MTLRKFLIGFSLFLIIAYFGVGFYVYSQAVATTCSVYEPEANNTPDNFSLGEKASWDPSKYFVKSYEDVQIKTLIVNAFKNKRISILAPVIRSRKGHYRELFEQIAKQGFVKVRVDGEIENITPGMRLDRYKIHDIEVVIDRMKIQSDSVDSKRLEDSIATAMNQGNNVLMVLAEDADNVRYFSRNLMCPTTGISYPNPEPNNFKIWCPCQESNLELPLRRRPFYPIKLQGLNLKFGRIFLSFVNFFRIK